MRQSKGLLITVILLSVILAAFCSYISVKWTLSQYGKTQRQIQQKSTSPINTSSSIAGSKISGFWANMTWDDTIGLSVLMGIMSAIAGFAVIWIPYMIIIKTLKKQQRKSFLPYQNYSAQSRTMKPWPKKEQAQA